MLTSSRCLVGTNVKDAVDERNQGIGIQNKARNTRKSKTIQAKMAWIGTRV